MDLLFKRYASPFLYLDALLESGNFARGVLNVWNAAQEDKLWEFYLSNNPMNKKSFEDWKKETQRQVQAQTPLSRAQIDATVKKSQEILQNFKPPQNKETT